MGGIFGMISNTRPVAPIIRAGLERLSHRGIDGAGIVTINDDDFIIKKDAGRIDQINKELNFDDMPGYIGLGHVRSATHGRPAYENTHPLLDCTGNLAIVMDGILSNYYELRKELGDAHNFTSRTDAELIVHLVEQGLNKGSNTINSLQYVQKLPGYFTIALLDKRDKKIYALSNGNPLIIATSENEVFLSSEEQALPMDQLKLYTLSTGQIAIMSANGIEFLSASTLQKLSLEPHRGIGQFIEPSKGAFNHFMQKEIYDTSEAISRAANVLQVEYLRDAWLLISKARNVILLGSGTSYHASLIGKYYLNTLANIKSETIPAGEFLYEGINNVEPGTLIIAISQSGESADIIRSIRMAKRRGAVVLGIINRLGSTLMRESNVYLPIGAGPEIAVPATKSFTASLAVLLQLASMAREELEWARMQLRRASSEIQEQLNSNAEKIRTITRDISDFFNMYVISGGPMGLPLAMEAALKLKEAAQIHSEAMSFREFKHGPMTLISSKFPVLAIMPGNDVDDDMGPVLSEIWHRGGYIVTISQSNKVRGTSDHLLLVKHDLDKLMTPIMFSPIIQLIAYRLGVARDIDVDNPRNLAKVVTA
ncbi:MAG: glutamine--fructose-6-phosphate transaminase (isomerizing) [Thermocladium sp.]|jgi:glucosamine--fructose-6-phosphate aminotransferase (isomerizing)